MSFYASAKRFFMSEWGRFSAVLAGLSFAATAFWLIGVISNTSWHYWYLVWNLLLAWIPFGLGFWLIHVAGKYGWRYKWSVVLAVLWLAFLPNAFYMITDYVHLQEFVRVNPMLDIIMFSTFVITGLALGFSSVAVVHNRLSKKIHGFTMTLGLAVVFFLCAFALYLGREMRWNSWDIITDPFGIVFNISDLIIHPGAHQNAFANIALFFGFLVVIYAAVWQTSRITRSR